MGQPPSKETLVSRRRFSRLWVIAASFAVFACLCGTAGAATIWIPVEMLQLADDDGGSPDEYLHAGPTDVAGEPRTIYRALAKWDLPEWDTITGAHLYMSEPDCWWGQSPDIWGYAVLDEWDEETDWASQPEFGDELHHGIGEGVCPDGHVSFDVTGVDPAKGVVLVGDEATETPGGYERVYEGATDQLDFMFVDDAFSTFVEVTYTIPGGVSVANLWVDTNGGTCTRQSSAAAYSDGAACASFDAAYEAASCGDTVGIKGGTYSGQTINASEKDCSSSYVTFTPRENEVFQSPGFSVEAGDWIKFLGNWSRGLDPALRNFKLRDNGVSGNTNTAAGFAMGLGMGSSEIVDHIWVQGADFETFLVRGADDVTFKSNEMAPGKTGHWDEKNWVSVGHNGVSYVNNYTTNMVIDGNDIHGFTQEECDGEGCHVECLTGEWENVTIKNNRLWDCDIFGIIFADDPSGGFSTIGTANVVENNFIQCCKTAGSNALAFGDTETGSVVTIRFNSIQGGVNNAFGGSVATVALLANIISSNSVTTCSSPFSFSYNVIAGGSGGNCGGTNTTAATGFVSAPSDLHIGPSATARSFVPLASCIGTDIDGDSRPIGSGTHCDAGADERS